ncbi:MAG: hypothetical protein K1060chlam1_00152 [Candidatus Anoxychlamydiales bacterium]|nr:hypothetical protein [Candidatus Anoxychlamydiales bacterium]
MDIRYEKTKLNILAWCIEDWTPLFSVFSFVEEFYHYEDLEVLKNTTLEIVKNLLEEGVIEAGFLQKDNTFKVWDKEIIEIIKEIKIKWDNLGRELYPHEIVWFDITEKGKKEFEYLNKLPELEDDPFYRDEN